MFRFPGVRTQQVLACLSAPMEKVTKTYKLVKKRIRFNKKKKKKNENCVAREWRIIITPGED